MGIEGTETSARFTVGDGDTENSLAQDPHETWEFFSLSVL